MQNFRKCNHKTMTVADTIDSHHRRPFIALRTNLRVTSILV